MKHNIILTRQGTWDLNHCLIEGVLYEYENFSIRIMNMSCDKLKEERRRNR
jgi:hypothetical protein